MKARIDLKTPTLPHSTWTQHMTITLGFKTTASVNKQVKLLNNIPYVLLLIGISLCFITDFNIINNNYILFV